MEIKRKINIYLKILILVFSLSIIYFVSHIRLNEAKVGYLDMLESNWGKGPLIDIIKVNETCPEKYELLIDDYWSGTIDGCLCNYIYQGKCNAQITKSDHCTDITQIDKFLFKKWKGNVLCGLRQKTNYLEIKTKNESCNDNEKSCGILDTKGNLLCIGINETCPINYINVTSNLNDFSEKVYRFIEMNEGYLVFSNKINNSQVIIDLRVSEETPCSNPDYENGEGRELYILDKYYHKNRCSDYIARKKLDERYTYIDKLNYSKFTNDTGLSKIFNRLPQFPQNLTKNYMKLFYINYIGLNISCVDKLVSTGYTIVEINKIIESINSIFIVIKSYYWIWNILILFAFFIYSVLIIVTIFLYVREFMIRFLLFIFPFLFGILIYSTNRLKDLILQMFLNFSNILLDTKCGDEYTNDAIEDYKDDLLVSYNIFITLLYLITIVLILTIVLFFIDVCLDLRVKEEKTIYIELK